MNKKTFRKWNRIIHRDLGYFFFGMTLIYAISGIAINHISNWNPNYIITNKKVESDIFAKEVTEKKAIALLKLYGEDETYKNYKIIGKTVRIYFQDGYININKQTGKGELEIIRKRPFFKEINWLHYNPNVWWTIFADIFAFSLLLLAISGLFIIKGKNSIKGRGAWLTIAGLLIPIIFFLIFS